MARRHRCWRDKKRRGASASVPAAGDLGQVPGPTKSATAAGSRIERAYQPVQPTHAQTSSVPSRIRKPELDEMGSARNRPLPARAYAARAPRVDPRSKAGAYGEQVKGPHKPTLDEMGPHAERSLPSAGRPLPPKPGPAPLVGGETLGATGAGSPTRSIDVTDARQRKKHRHGRQRKTGRPGA